MKELRDIKIDLLTGSQNPVIDLFNQITDGAEIINCDVYNKDGLEFIYFVPEKNEWIFYQDAKKDKFWCNFTTYWSFFESKLGLEYLEIQSITKYLVEDALKREVVTLNCSIISGLKPVEDALKREVVTLKCKSTFSTSAVEDALKREVVTPKKFKWVKNNALEDALKRDLATPPKLKNIKQSAVEEALKRELATPNSTLHLHLIGVDEALKREITPDSENPAEP